MNLKKKDYKMLENLYYRTKGVKFNVIPLRRGSLQKEVSPHLLKLCASCFSKVYPLTQTDRVITFLIYNNVRKVWRSPRIKQCENEGGDECGLPKLNNLLESSPAKQEMEMGYTSRSFSQQTMAAAKQVLHLAWLGTLPCVCAMSETPTFAL